MRIFEIHFNSFKKVISLLSSINLIFVLFSVVFFSNKAHCLSGSTYGESDYILEPYLGYERGYLTQNGIPEITTSGIGYGARLGARFWGIGFGLDYFMGSESATQSGQSSDFKPTEYGAFINYGFLSNYNIHATYLLSAKAKIQSSTNPEDFSGSGYKVGIGWSYYSFLNLNLDLFNRTYVKYSGSSISNSLLSSTAFVSLSFPIL